jgi:DNA-binding protein HU-beta
MKKKEFVKLLAVRLETTQREAEVVLTAVFKTIEDVLRAGDEVGVPKFGKFNTTVRGARTCRNPQTGDNMEVPEKRVPKFKASSVLKELVLE